MYLQIGDQGELLRLSKSRLTGPLHVLLQCTRRWAHGQTGEDAHGQTGQGVGWIGEGQRDEARGYKAVVVILPATRAHKARGTDG